MSELTSLNKSSIPRAPDKNKDQKIGQRTPVSIKMGLCNHFFLLKMIDTIPAIGITISRTTRETGVFVVLTGDADVICGDAVAADDGGSVVASVAMVGCVGVRFAFIGFDTRSTARVLLV
jgi:hypothetical protein